MIQFVFQLIQNYHMPKIQVKYLDVKIQREDKTKLPVLFCINVMSYDWLKN